MTVLIGIGGGTSTGKDTLSDLIIKFIKLWGKYTINRDLAVGLFSTDNAYKDLSYYSDLQRGLLTVNKDYNYDHPDIIDFEKLLEYALKMKRGQGFEYPLYDFTTHRYSKKYEMVPSKLDLGIIQGIYALYSGIQVSQENPNALLDTYDYKIFVNTPLAIAFLRRINRDQIERGRDLDGILAQLRGTVYEMHNRFILPTRYNADQIVEWITQEDVAQEHVKEHLLVLAKQISYHIFDLILQDLGLDPSLPDIPIDSIKIAPLIPPFYIEKLEDLNTK